MSSFLRIKAMISYTIPKISKLSDIWLHRIYEDESYSKKNLYRLHLILFILIR